METKNGCLAIKYFFLMVICLSPLPLAAEEYSGLINEDILRSVFVFMPEDTLKYSDCEKKTNPTCTYVWGVVSSKDEKRLTYGLAPDGNKLMLVFAQAKSHRNFERLLETYSDAETVSGLGVPAVWSAKRKQLSLITVDNLIVHINIDLKNGVEVQEKYISIAEHLLAEIEEGRIVNE